MNQESVIRVEKITKHFGRIHALKEISFEVKRGEVLGFLGPNGAGKTTTMRILTGFFPPSSGKVWIDGKALYPDPEKCKRWIGYLPEHVSLYQDMRVEEFLQFVSELRHLPRVIRKKEVDEKLGLCGLGDVRRRLIGPLSKGFKQRLGLAQALIGNPKVLVLDEPTNGLDPKQIIEIRALIRELGKQRTVILSTHILPEVSMICDRVLIVNQGRVVASGTPDQLEQGLRDQQEILVTSGAPDRLDETRALLAELEGVSNVKTLSLGDHIEFAVSAEKTKDLRPVISRLFVERGIPLLEIRVGKLSLEDIFMRLVVRENQEAEAS